jgi:hypothetical protein
MAMESRAKADEAEVKRWNVRIVVVAIVLAVILASFAAYLAWVRPWAHGVGAEDLSVSLTISGGPYVTLSGKVFNIGDKDAYFNVIATISDARGYVFQDTFAVGRIDSDGGFTDVNKTYDWPTYYLGSYVSYAEPITLTVALSWTDAR